MSNEWHKSQAIKRGGGQTHLSLEFDRGEKLLQQEPATEQTAERIYERRWAMTLLNQVLERLRHEYVAAEKSNVYTELKQFLTPGNGVLFSRRRTTQHERRRRSGGSSSIAARFRETLRDEIANTISERSDVDDEIHALFETFSN